MTHTDNDFDDRLLPDAKVMARYGVSHMALKRWDENPQLEFPPPIYINNRKYRRLSELIEFERKRARSGPPANMPKGPRRKVMEGLQDGTL